MATHRHSDRDKVEQELAMNIKKAVNSDETAPKQKHVRSCIVYTWDAKSSQSFWMGLKVQPLLADEVQCFKALITIHKVIRGGHPVTLREAMNEIGFLEVLSQSFSQDSFKGYGVLIRAYVDFIIAKLEYHRLHPEFNGNFDYEDYVSVKGVDDPNEGYETIADLMNLQDRIDTFQKLIFRTFRPVSDNECRISALVPLVEESYGIYEFATRMLMAMHRRVESHEPLEPLRARFNAQHYALRKFYYECSNISYLTSLIAIPKLDQDPPNFLAQSPSSAPRLPPRHVTPPPEEPKVDPLEEQRKQLALQKEYEEQQRLLRERQMQEQAQNRYNELEQEIMNYRNQQDRDMMLMSQYDQRIKALENELARLGLANQRNDGDLDALIKQLQDEIAQWKAKYEALAKIYAKLRQEHLELLGKLKQVNLKANAATEATHKFDRMQSELKAKNTELMDMIRERDRAKDELERLRGADSGELTRMKRELDDSKAKIEKLMESAGGELADMRRRFEQEQRELEDVLRDKREAEEGIARDWEIVKNELDKATAAKEEEIAILQAGMDQSLMALAELQDTSSATESELQKRVDALRGEQTSKLHTILDSVFRSCIKKLNDAAFELTSPATQGNQSATAQYVLSMVERAYIASSEFAISYLQYLTDFEDQISVINTATAFAEAVSQLLDNVKGVTRLADEDDQVEEIIRSGRYSAEAAEGFFTNMLSTNILSIPETNRPDEIAKGNNDIQVTLNRLIQLIEALLPKDSHTAGQEDLAALVEREMLNAARTVEDATEKLSNLRNEPKRAEVSSEDHQIHNALLDTAAAMTRAIVNLVRCAHASQQEIVDQGRGSLSKNAYYKKNNRWTEGLVSAARGVSSATNTLVEVANGVIRGTHTLEQLIDASNDVATATAQLVAAARVKANMYSKTQENLELASRAVTDASRDVVKAVKAFTARRKEEKDLDLSKLSIQDHKLREMEQQVTILKLEKELNNARRKANEFKKYYQDEDEE
ncbi:ANTH-domain-containing protein [Basidiobolus meristosporus CBS 931.73]|uniref:ANTH-domain-containing protein n=1 Tax=Basidiobolus meristosporus CBS 931.73 TaxID=1314790 RepID=A0A1Y1X904_9FUNG|nr:ANTH-domain-containing protein [Basidiobolus meristosporus CBS 931.73]|eukprot:ORX82233.1 ANTH-domain-containing protein [Basidiobolus meristosporus CBS 931.73]